MVNGFLSWSVSLRVALWWRTSSIALACVVAIALLSNAGCGGGGDDFSKPLEMPKAPPMAADQTEQPSVAKTPKPEASGETTAKAEASDESGSATASTADVAKTGDNPDAASATAEKTPASTEPREGAPAAIKDAIANKIGKPNGSNSEPSSPTPSAVPATDARAAKLVPAPSVALMAVAKPTEPTTPKPQTQVASVDSKTTKPEVSKTADASKPSIPEIAEPKVVVEPLTADEREWLGMRQRQAVSLDGQFALTAVSSSRLSVHDIRSRSLAQENYGQTQLVTALAIGPQRRWIVAADETGSLRLWTTSKTTAGLDRIARDELRQAEAALPTTSSEQGPVRVIAVHPNGQSFVSGGDDGSLQVWNIVEIDNSLTLQKARRWQAHQAAVTAIGISADRRWIASGGQDRQVNLWEAQTGKPARTWSDSKAAISDVALSADGKVIAASSLSKTVHWWSAEVSPTPEVAANSKDATDAKLREKPAANAPKVAPIPTSFDHPDLVLSVAVSTDGKQLLTGCKDKLIRVWDLTTGKLVGRPEPSKDAVVEVRYLDGDQRLLTRDRSGAIRNRPRVAVASSDDEDTPRAVPSAQGEWLFLTPSELLSVARVTPSNLTASTQGGTVSTTNSRLPDLLTKLRLAESRSDRDEARAAYFSPAVAEPKENEEPTKLPRWKAPTNSVEKSDRPQLIGSITTAFQFGATGNESARATAKNVKLALLSDGEFLTAFETPTQEAEVEYRNRNANEAKSSYQVWLWDVPTQGVLRHWDDLNEAPPSLQFVGARNQLVSPNSSQCLSLANGVASSVTEPAINERPQRIAISPDGSRLAVTYAGTKQTTSKVVRILDPVTLKELAAFEAFEAIGTALEFLPDGNSLLVAIRERQMHRLLMLDASTLTVQTTLEEQPHPQPWLQGTEREGAQDRGISSLVISADGRSAISSGSYGNGDFRMTLWQRRGPKWIRETHGSAKAAQPIVDERRHPSPMWFVGGKTNQLAAISPKGLGIVDTSNGRLLRAIDLKDGSKDRGPYAWSSDGSWFVQGDNAGNVALWNLRLEKEPGYFTAHLGPVKALALSHDGQTLASLGEENQLHLWNLANWLPKNRVIAKKQATRPAPSSD